MSGVEVAGLVLGVLPLFIEAAKAYAEGVDSILDVTIKSRREEKLEDFYDDFYFQVVSLHEHMNNICQHVEATYTGNRNLLNTVETFLEGRFDPDLEKSLQRYFNSDDRFNEFTRISTKILQLLQKLINDKTNKLSLTDQAEESMFQTMKAFATSRKQNTTRNVFHENFRFFRAERKRRDCMSGLEKWNRRLERLVVRVEHRSNTNNQYSNSARLTQTSIRNITPSVEVRDLIAKLYTTLRSRCNCANSGDHDIKLCLRVGGNLPTTNQALDLDFLFSSRSSAQASDNWTWQEGCLCIVSKSAPGQSLDSDMSSICDVFRAQMQDLSLRFLFSDVNGHQSLCSLQPIPRRLQVSETSHPISLKQLLKSAVKMSPLEKRKLALIFAYSLLLYHDTPWLSQGWNKEDIVFFYRAVDEPNLEHPFLSGRLGGTHSGSKQAPDALMHRNPGILALAILLIEICNEKPIETWRTSKELAKRSGNIDIIVAHRVVKKMDQCPSQKAAIACLDLDWVAATNPAGLDDPYVRKGFVENVIVPIEEEVNWLSSL